MVFDERILKHMMDMNNERKRKTSYIVNFALLLFSNKLIRLLITILESILGFFLTLPLPIIKEYILKDITNLPGSPYFLGNYIRSIYWKMRLGKLGMNTLIEQGVIFRFPKNVFLDDFVLIDKHVLLEAGKVVIGKRVHIAENCCISGGGVFIMEDYSCMAQSSAVVTATDTPANGYRGTGPMIPWEQRFVVIGKVSIKKDAFIGMAARILNDVVIGEGAVVAACSLVRKDVAPWNIVAGIPAKSIGTRQAVKFTDPD